MNAGFAARGRSSSLVTASSSFVARRSAFVVRCSELVARYVSHRRRQLDFGSVCPGMRVLQPGPRVADALAGVRSLLAEPPSLHAAVLRALRRAGRACGCSTRVPAGKQSDQRRSRAWSVRRSTSRPPSRLEVRPAPIVGGAPRRAPTIGRRDDVRRRRRPNPRAAPPVAAMAARLQPGHRPRQCLARPRCAFVAGDPSHASHEAAVRARCRREARQCPRRVCPRRANIVAAREVGTTHRRRHARAGGRRDDDWRDAGGMCGSAAAAWRPRSPSGDDGESSTGSETYVGPNFSSGNRSLARASEL